MLFGCYRRGDANDPDVYVRAIAAVLSTYDADLIRQVTDPRTGISTTEKYMSFMPNAGELKVYCDGVAARRERIERLGALPAPAVNRPRLPPPPPSPGDKATIFVPASSSRYSALVEWAERPDTDPRLFKFETRPGIWVAWEIWDRPTMRAREAATEPARLQLSEDARRAMAEMDALRQPIRDAAE